MGLVLGERVLLEQWCDLGTEIMGFSINTWTVGIATNEVEGFVHYQLWIPLCQKIVDCLDTKNYMKYAIRKKD